MILENYFDRITEKSKPHLDFISNWSSYSEYEFAETFLPKADLFYGSHFRIYDSAEIFNQIQKSEDRILTPLKETKPFQVVAYTYSNGCLASQKSQTLSLKEDQIAFFLEVNEQSEVLMTFKFGYKFKSFLEKNSKILGLKSTVTDLEKTRKRSNLAELKSIFQKGAVHHNLVMFILKNLNIDSAIVIEDIENMALTNLFKNIKELDDIDSVLFDAGEVKDKHSNSWAHGDIERVALYKAGYSDEEIIKIYSGNWLRDISSAVDVTLVGFSHYDSKTLQKNSIFYTNEAVQEKLSFFLFFTQKGLTQLLHYFTVDSFIVQRLDNPSYNFLKHIKSYQDKYGEFTEDILGVYRPEEHIDNPKGMIDNSIFGNKLLRDPIEFNYEYINEYNQVFNLKKTLSKGEIDEALEISEQNMKAYIKHDFEDRPSSFTYISQQLRLASKKGRKNLDALRHFGAALHVLEDYYAHTNFIELTLIKLGYINIFPWVEPNAEVESISDGKLKASKIPIVTGTFGTLDTAASLLPKVLDLIRPEEEEYKSIGFAERTYFDVCFLVILKDIADREKGMPESEKMTFFEYTAEFLLECFQNYLHYRDSWEYAKKLFPPLALVSIAEEVVFYLMEALGIFTMVRDYIVDMMKNLIIDYSGLAGQQVISTIQDFNFGTNPTHTQLAKDSALHSFNPISGTLASMAVNDIANMMDQCWKRKISIDKVINRIENHYFVHPNDTDWMDETVKEWAEGEKSWLAEFVFEIADHSHFDEESQTHFNRRRLTKKDLDYLKNISLPKIPSVKP